MQSFCYTYQLVIHTGCAFRFYLSSPQKDLLDQFGGFLVKLVQTQICMFDDFASQILNV